MDIKRIRIWDLPTRLFHWMLVLCVVASFVSGQLGGNLIEWHGKIGLFIVGLIVFRLVWGLIGSTYARFTQFFPTPAKLKAYLRGDWRGVGHNPLGAFSVFGLLALVGIQVSTGLFSNDDITFFGPLYELVSKDVSNQLTGLHKLSSNLLLVLIGLHLCAIAFYTRVKKDNLIKPMLRGWKETDEGESAKGGGVLALLVALAIALAAVYAASGALLPPPPPPAPVAETPSW
jgi:cytochrome b